MSQDKTPFSHLTNTPSALARLTLTLLFMLLLASACTFATVRSLEEAEQAQQGFDVVGYVDSIWESEYLPTYENEAVDIVELLAALDDDEEEAIETYGHRSGTGAFSFMVRGEARILTFDDSSSARVLRLDLPPYDDDAEVSLAIGPVIRGNAVRDAVGFIQFNQFTNQMDFASVYRELNDRVKEEILSQYEFDESFEGRTFSFRGAFTYDDPDNIVIVPVFLEEQS